MTSAERILVSPSALSVDAAIASVRGPDAGGIVVFVGTVRDASRGKRVRHLEYEAYPEMAEAKMREIGAALEREHHPPASRPTIASPTSRPARAGGSSVPGP